MGSASSVSKSSQVLPDTAPNWKSDDSTDECEICDKEFNVIRRKHHCRACGDIICSACFTKNKSIECELKMYGYMEEQFVCQQCLPLLHDNFFMNNLKQIKKFSKYLFNEIQLINPLIYNHIYRGFAGHNDSHQFMQLSADKHFVILIPHHFAAEVEENKSNFSETIDLNAIRNEFDFYKLWKPKRTLFESKSISPNTIQLLYLIAKQKQYINKNDNFIFLPKDVHCYGLENDLFILPKIISVNLTKATKEWLQQYRNRNTKTNPITKTDIFSVLNGEMKQIYVLQNNTQEKFEAIKSVKNATNLMQNAQYYQMIGQYDKLHLKFNAAYDAFVKYKKENNEKHDAVDVDEYIKLMYNQSKMSEIDAALSQNQKCAFCREIFEESFEPYTITYCPHKYCFTCCNAIILLWIRFDLYTICIVNGCYAKCVDIDTVDIDLAQHVKNRFYVLKQTQLCNINLINININNVNVNDYYQFILNVLNILDENLWKSIVPKLMQHNDINKHLIKIIKRVNVTGIEFHQDFEDCDDKTADNEYDDDEQFTYWKSRYFFEIGALIKEKEFRNKFICCCQCILKYPFKEIQVFMDNFSKYFDNICHQILIDTICDSYQQCDKLELHINEEWVDALELFILNICCQLNMDISTRIMILCKVQNKLMDNVQECNSNSGECDIVSKLVIQCSSNSKEMQTMSKLSKEEYVSFYDIFYHCLLYHNKTEIYKLLFNDGAHECGTEKCVIYERHIDNANSGNKSIKYMDNINIRLMDRIHCYYFDISKHSDMDEKENKYDQGIAINESVFDNLKQEILNCSFEWCLLEIEWKILINECKLMYKTMHVKQPCYVVMDNNDQYYDSISFMEIVTVKLYTDYPVLRNKMMQPQYFKYYYHYHRLLRMLYNDGFKQKHTQKMNVLYQMVGNNLTNKKQQ